MISLINVNKSFGSKKIIDNIDISIMENEVTFIVGSSGAGKSTLLNLIGGLDSVSSGQILYNNSDITKELNAYRSQHVGFIFQDSNLISGLSARKNVELGLLYCNKYENIQIIDSSLELLGIQDKNQKIETLSGGEKQRTAIARSICKEANIIIADEPTGNLDSKNADTVFQLLVDSKKGKHIIVVTHDLEKAQKYGDRIITIKDGKVINDSAKSNNVNLENSDNPIKPIAVRPKIDWNSVWMLGINSIKLRKSKIISISLAIALAISALVTMLYFDNYGNKISKDVNTNYLENDLISLFYESTMNLGYQETPFLEDNIQDIKEEYDIKEIVPIYQELDGVWGFSNNNKFKNATLKQININSFFKERVMSNDVEGKFLKNEDEIILAKDVAEELFSEDCIGKNIILNNGKGQAIKLKIVGINNTVNAFDKIYSFISSNKIKELLKEELDERKNSRIELQKLYTEYVSVKTDGIYGMMSEYKGTENILYGQAPINKQEVMISSQLCKYALEEFNLESYTEEQIVDNKVPNDIIQKLFLQKLGLNHNGLFEVNICGIYESDKIGFLFSEELIQSMDLLEPVILDVYVSNADNVASVKKHIQNNEEFKVVLQLENLKSNISSQTQFFKYALLLIGLIMIFISISMLNSFSKISVLERKKEIAIIKSLGANDKTVLFTLLFDSIVLSAFSLIGALVVNRILARVLPCIIDTMKYQNFDYSIILTIIVSLIFTVSICIYTTINLRSIVKKLPASLIQ